ncbi:MAG: DUF427 domain-containing protein [Pseudomonadales bacterium]
MWEYTGQKRPPFAIEPGSDQESVWDYPRPPALVKDERLVEVRNTTEELARTNHAFRLLETAGPPTFYIPPNDVNWDSLMVVAGSSMCEWKGAATYFAIRTDPETAIAWSYTTPNKKYAQLQNFVGFYPGRIACFVNDERVRAQPGHFYGGWITAEIVGPFKGDPGSNNW